MTEIIERNQGRQEKLMHIFKVPFLFGFFSNQKFIIPTKFPALNGGLDLMTARDPFLFKLVCGAVSPLMTNEGSPHQSRIKVTI